MRLGASFNASDVTPWHDSARAAGGELRPALCVEMTPRLPVYMCVCHTSTDGLKGRYFHTRVRTRKTRARTDGRRESVPPPEGRRHPEGWVSGPEEKSAVKWDSEQKVLRSRQSPEGATLNRKPEPLAEEERKS